MEPQEKKLVYLVGILGIILLTVLFVWTVVGRKKVVSPVPEEGIKVIFTSPSPTPTATASPTPKPKISPSPSPSPTPKPTPTVSPSPTPTPSPSPSPTL